MIQLFKAVWRFRGYIVESIKREFQSKYQNSLIGSFWAVINPLAMILVYTLIFSAVMKAKLPNVDGEYAYSIYLCAGILTWGFFSEVVLRGLNMFLENANLLKKMSFPRFCLPVIVLSTGLVNFAIIFLLFTVFMLLSGNFPGVVYISVFPLLALLALFSIGLGITLGIFNVFFRDVGQLMGVVMTFWFWLTPIIYPANILNESLQSILRWNPLTSMMSAFQTVLVYGQWPDWQSLVPFMLLALILNIIGMYLFRQHAGDIVDEL